MKVTLEHALKLNPRLNPNLFIPDPKMVLKKMDEPPIRDWLDFISKKYEMKKVKNLILIPCSFYKPYDPPNDEFYRRINSLRKRINNSKLITISVPLGLEPEEFWSFQWNGNNLIYDCPFFPWIEKFGYRWDERIAERVFSRLKEVIENFFVRNKGFYERVIAFFTPESDELKLVREHSDYLVLNYSPEVEVSYNNNTSEVYCNPDVWGDFEKALRKFGLLEG